MQTLLLTIARHKEFLASAFVILAGLAFFSSFDVSDTVSPWLQGLIASVAVFFVIPVLYCKIVLERPLSALGFQRGNAWAGVGGSVIALGSAFAALFVLWNFTPLLDGYLLPVAVREQFLFFVLYEVLLNGLSLLLLEVFFRGMILLLWLRDFRIWGVFFQAGIYALILYLSYDINAQTIPLLLFAPFAGLIAYQSRSIWYSFGASWFFLLTVDVLILILR